MVNKVFFSFLVLVLFSFPTLGQNDITQQLFKSGFEKVLVLESNDTLTVYFEHRTFRNPQQSMLLANRIIEVFGIKTVFFIPLYHNQPIGKYSGEDLTFSDLNKNEIDFFKNNNNSLEGYRFHLRISPDISARFGKFDDPFQNKTNVILDTRVYLLSGLSLHSGILFPINNNLDAQEKNFRLAPSHLHFFRSYGCKHFFSLTGGLFFSDRYGFDFQYRFMPMTKPWSLGIESSLTGFYFLPNSGIYMNPIDDFSFLVNFEYRIPWVPSVSLGFTAGQFLFKDKGGRADFIKQFGNVDIGFFAAMTQSGTNAGFQFAFPLFPGKMFRNKNVEFRTTEEFRWEYGFNNEDVVARKFRLGTPRLQDVLRQYHPLFLKSQKY